MIEQRVQRARMVVAVPPEPIGALRDVDFVPGSFQSGSIVAQGSFLCHQKRTGGVKGVPRLVVFGMADPDRKVVADPASGEEAVQGVDRRVLFEELAHLDRPKMGASGHSM